MSSSGLLRIGLPRVCQSELTASTVEFKFSSLDTNLVQCLTLLVLYPEHSTTRPSALQPQPNGVSPAETRRPQSNLIPNLAFLAPWRKEIRSQSSKNKCVHLRGTTLVQEDFYGSYVRAPVCGLENLTPIRSDPRSSPNSASSAGIVWYPAVDVLESKDAYLLRAELPRMNKEDFNLEVKNGILTISGERKLEEPVSGVQYRSVERVAGKFSRSLYLPQTVSRMESRQLIATASWKSTA
jgi:HSP20 family molecular chaperone IbpA